MHAAERQAIMLTFWKDLRSAEKVVLLAIWSCASLHPRGCVEVVRSSCLGVWIVELEVNGLPTLDSSCDLDDSVVWKSILRSERTLPCWGSLEVRQLPGELEMQRRELHTLRFWRFLRILPDDFSLRRFLANFSVCHELLDLFFVISEANTFRKGKVVINKSASFFW